MLTFNSIKELAKITSSNKVMKAALGLNDGYIDYVKRLYDVSMFGNEKLNVPASYIDIIAENYINQRLLNDKTCIEKLIQVKEFRIKLASMSLEDLEKYMNICDENSFNDVVTNGDIIANYTPKDHFALIEMSKELRNKKSSLKDMFFMAIKNKVSIENIKKLLKVLEESLTDANAEEMNILINSDEYYKLPMAIKKRCIGLILVTEDARKRKLFAKIIAKGAWYDNISIENVVALVGITTISSQSILEKDSIFEYTYEEIVKIIQTINGCNHLITIFASETVTSHLSYDDIMELIDKYDLNDTGNFDKFVTVLSQIVQKGIENSLYDDLCLALDKEIYQTTISDYLDTCASIEEFILCLEGQYKDSDPIDPNARLFLKN